MVKSRNALLRTLLLRIARHLKSVLRHKFLIWMSVIGTLCIYLCQDVRIRGYFSKAKGVGEQNVWETMTYIYIYKIHVMNYDTDC